MNKDIGTNDKSHLESELDVSAKKVEIQKLNSVLDEILKIKYILDNLLDAGLNQGDIINALKNPSEFIATAMDGNMRIGYLMEGHEHRGKDGIHRYGYSDSHP